MRKVFLILMLLQQMYVAAQITVEITGPTTANVGETKSYSLIWRDGFYQIDAPWGGTPNWNAIGGTVTFGNANGGSVQWNASGPRSVFFEYYTWNDFYYDDLMVTVSGGVPSAPTATAATLVSNTSFTANWSAVSGATSYRLDVSTSNTFSSFVPGYNNLTVSSTSQSVTSLSANTTYYYRVRAVNSSGTSGNSNTSTVLTAPGAPTATAATVVTTTSFTANWGAVSGATSYRLDVSMSNTFSNFVSGYSNLTVSATNRSVTGLTAGTTYYYRVRSVNSGGTSANSNVITSPTLPAAPTANAGSSITSSSFLASWNTITGATSYRLDVSTSNTFSSFVPGYNNLTVSGTSQSVTGISSGTAYYYRVRAVNGGGTSANSNTVTVTTTAGPPPMPTATTASSFTTTSFTANWGAVSGATSYRLDVSTSNTFSSFVPGYNNLSVSTINRSVTGLVAGTTYYYRVRAVGAGGTSGNSNTITAITIPLPPTTVNSTAIGSDSFTANWSSVSGATSYRLDVSKDNFATYVDGYQNLTVTSTSRAVTGLLPTIAYKYRVRSVNGSGAASSNSAEGAVTTRILNYNQNFIRTVVAQNEGITTESQLEAAPMNDKQVTYQFFDGLGRPSQTVAVQQSPNQMDIVQPIAYDAFGREAVKYLPYVSGSDGSYKINPVGTTNYTGSPHHTFYNETNSLIARDVAPYSETVFEPSPLNRVIKQGAPGTTWQPDGNHSYASSDHSIKMGYEFNAANEVLLWTFTYPTEQYTTTATNAFGKVNAGTTASPIYYAANQLYKNLTKDEQGNQVVEYVDKQGRTVLKRVQAVAGSHPTTGTNKDVNYASTYYIYDDFNNLVCVIPPEATKRLAAEYYHPASTDGSKNTFLKQWAFRYRYDGRKRMTMKQVPGAEPVYMVYDKRDRLVLTQDGVQRPNNRWLFTKYDALNRPVLTGMYTTATGIGRDSLQTIVNNYYASLDANKAWFETFTGNTTDVYGYDNKSFPNETIQGNYLSVTYYDDYTFLGLLPAGYDYVDENLATEKNGITYHQPDTEFTRVKGLVTGSKVKVLNGGTTGYSWLNTVNYYDDRYRVVQTITDNYKNSTDRITNVYDFVGTVLQSKTTHKTNELHWKDLVGVQLVGDKFTRTASSSGWGTSGAASVEMLPANGEGWFEFTTVTANKSIMIGYSPSNTDAQWTSIKYALFLSSGTLQVRENGGSTNYLGSGHTYQAGDRFRIERKNGKINYYKNGVFLLERNAVSDALLIDFSINSTAGELAGFRSSFGAMAQDSISRRMVYDHAGRLLQTFHRVNDDDEVLLTQNSYNELGELVTKELHSRNETDFAQQVDYRYNIRGWLNSINDPSLNANALFNFLLKYHDPVTNGGTAQYNGNISQAIWKTAGSDEASYGYYYDVMNRITEAKYFNHIRPTENNRFNETIKDGSNSGYDLNGNIKKLQRNGSLTANTYGLMDNLTYTYSGNRLTRVDDAVATQAHENGFKELVKTSNEYTYDANGNMITDQNKGITAITYNHLNLPVKVNKGTTNYILYTYDATGRKLKQQVYGTTPKTTDYAGEFIYENDTLRFINHEEGRILPDTSSTAQHPWEYQYHLKDHLGNVRVTFSEKTTTDEYLATMEKDPSSIDTQENNMFLNMVSSKKVAFYNHTPNAQTGYSYRLSASSTELIGPAKSFEVNSGDVIDLEVYVRYANLTTTNSGLSNLFNSLVGAFSLNPGGGIGLEGQQAYNAFNGMFGSGTFIGSGDWDENAPKAYLNFILFDEDFNLIDFGFDQLSQSAGSAHELLSLHVKVQQKGYLYIYLSNENDKIVDVYFDDFKIVYHTAVEQWDDYYPFGLTFNSYQRENTLLNNYLYNSKELEIELDLYWYDYQARQYDPALGRFTSVDPAADLMRRFSPYTYAFDNPIRFTDPDGMMPSDCCGPIKDWYKAAKETVASGYKTTKETVSQAYQTTKEAVSSAYESTKETIAGLYGDTKSGEIVKSMPGYDPQKSLKAGADYKAGLFAEIDMNGVNANVDVASVTVATGKAELTENGIKTSGTHILNGETTLTNGAGLEVAGAGIEFTNSQDPSKYNSATQSLETTSPIIPGVINYTSTLTQDNKGNVLNTTGYSSSFRAGFILGAGVKVEYTRTDTLKRGN